MIAQYSAIRNRLLLSASLGDTGLALPFVNRSTLRLWLKKHTRRDIVRTLLHGLEVPLPALTAQEPLLPAQARSFPQVAEHLQHSIVEQDDTRGQAVIRGALANDVLLGSEGPVPSTFTQAVITNQIQASSDTVAVQSLLQTKSRTTDWRRRKRAAESAGIPVARKARTCPTCGKPTISEGHSQFQGQPYCPQVPGIAPKDEWLALKKAEFAAKKAAKKRGALPK